MDLVRRPDSVRPNPARMRTAREDLISGAKRFVTASKALVKSATVMMSDGPAGGGGGGVTDPDMSSSPCNAVGPGGRPTSLAPSGSSGGHKHLLFHESLVRCTDLVAMMFGAAAEVAQYSATSGDAGLLVEGLLLVAVAFRSTVQAALRPSTTNTAPPPPAASGPPPPPTNSLHDPAVKMLMSEATKLAASLTTLMKTIRGLESGGGGGSGVSGGTAAQNGDGEAGVTFGEPTLISSSSGGGNNSGSMSNAHHVLAMI